MSSDSGRNRIDTGAELVVKMIKCELDERLSVPVLKTNLLVVVEAAKALCLEVASIEDQRASLLALYSEKYRHPTTGLMGLIRVHRVGEAQTTLALTQPPLKGLLRSRREVIPLLEVESQMGNDAILLGDNWHAKAGAEPQRVQVLVELLARA